jgi:DNA-binding MarR family transcriptional regulator
LRTSSRPIWPRGYPPAPPSQRLRTRAEAAPAGRARRVRDRLAARAGVELPPPELWLLARLGERSPLSGPQLVEQLQVDERALGEALDQLRRRALVDGRGNETISLTPSGRADYERVVAARCARLRELLDGWRPEQEAELQQLIDGLGRDLVSHIPRPPDPTPRS